MSTRANIIIKDSYESLIFYRHSDGYPMGVKDTLETFMQWLKSGKIRNNVSQAAGWLIILGAAELDYKLEWEPELKHVPKNTPLAAYAPIESGNLYGWKVGAYEPAAGLSGDIEFLYEIDLEAETLTGWRYNGAKGQEVTWRSEQQESVGY